MSTCSTAGFSRTPTANIGVCESPISRRYLSGLKTDGTVTLKRQRFLSAAMGSCAGGWPSAVTNSVARCGLPAGFLMSAAISTLGPTSTSVLPGVTLTISTDPTEGTNFHGANNLAAAAPVGNPDVAADGDQHQERQDDRRFGQVARQLHAIAEAAAAGWAGGDTVEGQRADLGCRVVDGRFAERPIGILAVLGKLHHVRSDCCPSRERPPQRAEQPLPSCARRGANGGPSPRPATASPEPTPGTRPRGPAARTLPRRRPA